MLSKMNATPFFSIIIPTYNRAALISETLQSIENQTVRDFEVIVIDDGSTDHTEQVVNNFSCNNLRYLKIANSERGAARNKGMELAKGQYFTFLDSDDLLEPGFLAHALVVLQQHHYPKFFHLGYAIYNQKGKIVRKMDPIKKGDIHFIIKGNPLSCIGIFMHSSLYPRFQFNEDRRLSGSEDWELWIRLIANCGIVTDSTPMARIIDHSDRSVIHFKENNLVMRKSLAVAYALADPVVRKIFGKFQYKIDAYWSSYVALHLAMNGEKLQSLRYLCLGAILYPLILLEKRSVVILLFLFRR